MLQTVFFERIEDENLRNVSDVKLKMEYKVTDEKKEILGFHIKLDLNILEKKYIETENTVSIEDFFLLLFSKNQKILDELKRKNEFYQSVYIIRDQILDYMKKMTENCEKMMNH